MDYFLTEDQKEIKKIGSQDRGREGRALSGPSSTRKRSSRGRS